MGPERHVTGIAAPLNQLRLNIDASAETVLTKFDGDFEPLEHLKYDVTNIGHYVVKDGRVFIIGAGGGRDVLSALVFDQEQVVARRDERRHHRRGQQRFGDFTGHLDRHPRCASSTTRRAVIWPARPSRST